MPGTLSRRDGGKVKGKRTRDFKEVVSEIFREKQKQPSLTLSVLRQNWRGILGEDLAEKTHPARITRNTLWINTLDSSWAFQLQFLKEEILQSVQAFLESPAITDLRFKPGDVPQKHPETVPEEAPEEAQEPGSAPAPGSPPARAAEEPPVTGAISDSSLRNSFHRWLSGQKRRRRESAPPSQDTPQ